MKRYIIFLSVFLVACGSSKKVVEEELIPEWVKLKPIVSGYYVGIGGVKKVGTTAQYTAKARDEALVDLTGDISSQVSSSSVLHSIEQDYKVSETYTQTIQITTDDYVEGFDPVDQYETEDMYWVYYRIEKSTYHEMKEKKKKEAVKLALSKYESGLTSQSGNNAKEAMTFYLQGLQAIKRYMSEETPIEKGGETIDIGNKLYSSLNDIINALAIIPVTQSFDAKKGSEINQKIVYKVTFENKPVQDIPVRFSYSGGYLTQDRMDSDISGKVTLQPGRVSSKNHQEKYSASIDLKEIAQKAVQDLFIRGLINKRTLEPATVNVKIIQPTLGFEIINSPCGKDDCSRIKTMFVEKTGTSGYKFIDDITKADFKIKFSYSYSKGTSAGNLTSSMLSGQLSIYDDSNNLVWSKDIPSIKGVAQSQPDAQQNAFKELISSLNRRYFNEALDQLK